MSNTAAEEKTDVKAREVRDDVVDDFTLEQHHDFYATFSSLSIARQVNGDTPSVRGLGPSPRHRYKVVTAKHSNLQISGNVSNVKTLKLLFSWRMQHYLFSMNEKHTLQS